MRFPLLVPILAAAALAVAATPAAALPHRTAHDPCEKHGDDPSTNDEGANGVLHCSGRDVIPSAHQPGSAGSHSIDPDERPSDCAPGTVIKGTRNFASRGIEFFHPHWFYAPTHGQWITWTPEVISHWVKLAPDGKGAVNLNPKFFNHHSRHGWEVRLFFYCEPLKD
jgi:hypothetical protein